MKSINHPKKLNKKKTTTSSRITNVVSVIADACKSQNRKWFTIFVIF